MITTLAMDPFEAYKLYLALKSHFTTKTYDYFKYNGQVKANRATFDTRRDKFFFQKLSKRKDVKDFLVAIFAYGNKDMWVGDIVNNQEMESVYKKWQKVNQSLTYVFMSDLEKFDKNLVNSFTVEEGQHPHALKLFLKGEITIETLIIMNNIMKFTPYWNKNIEDVVIWPNVRHLCKKYQPFMTFDLDKCRQIVVDKFDLKM